MRGKEQKQVCKYFPQALLQDKQHDEDNRFGAKHTVRKEKC